MLKSISLECVNCGANLAVAPGVTVFNCRYCGASQILERSGSEASLKTVSDAPPTDAARLAAELAITRLQNEMQTAENSLYELGIRERLEYSNINRRFKIIWITVSIFCLMSITYQTWLTVLTVITWVGLMITIHYFYLKKDQSGDCRFCRRQNGNYEPSDRYSKSNYN